MSDQPSNVEAIAEKLVEDKRFRDILRTTIIKRLNPEIRGLAAKQIFHRVCRYVSDTYSVEEKIAWDAIMGALQRLALESL